MVHISTFGSVEKHESISEIQLTKCVRSDQHFGVEYFTKSQHSGVMVFAVVLVLLTIICSLQTGLSREVSTGDTKPLIIGHRGSTGELPDSTLEAFERAVQQGADVIEFDICVTKDGKLVVNHDVELGKSTNVANFSEFASRKRTVNMTTTQESYPVNTWTTTNWMVFDFTLAEIRRLRKFQRQPFRNHQFDGLYSVPSLVDALQFFKKHKNIGIMAELKFPSFFNKYLREQLKKDTSMEQLVLNDINQVFPDKKTRPQIMLEVFEQDSVARLVKMTDIPVFLLYHFGFPDKVYLKRLKQSGVYGVAPWKMTLIGVMSPKDNKGNKWSYNIPTKSKLIEEAHAEGLKIVTWTFRNEDEYLPWNYGNDPMREYDTYFKLGVDGVITDFPATAKRAMLTYYTRNSGNKLISSFFVLIFGLVIAYICE